MGEVAAAQAGALQTTIEFEWAHGLAEGDQTSVPRHFRAQPRKPTATDT